MDMTRRWGAGLRGRRRPVQGRGRRRPRCRWGRPDPGNRLWVQLRLEPILCQHVVEVPVVLPMLPLPSVPAGGWHSLYLVVVDGRLPLRLDDAPPAWVVVVVVRVRMLFRREALAMSPDGGTPLPCVCQEQRDGKATEADRPAMGQLHSRRHEDAVLGKHEHLLLRLVHVVAWATIGFIVVPHLHRRDVEDRGEGKRRKVWMRRDGTRRNY